MLITGQKSHADRFEQGIVQFLADQMSNATAWRVDAAFGVFGSLPLVGVTFDDVFVLLDTTNGVMDGPFDLDSPLDATVLLAQHGAYAAGSTVRYVSFSGCPKTNVGIWHPSTPLPPGSAPRPPCTLPLVQCRLPIWPGGMPPAPPLYPPTPPFNPLVPGWTGCTCPATGLCSEVDRGTLPGGGVYLRIRYYNCATATLPLTGCPSASSPPCTVVQEDWWEF